jgi:Na+/melibiose symporter-like transporter
MKKNDPDYLESKLRYFIGVSLTMILGGSIFIILYSLVFVTQPLGESSENDRALFAILTPIASFITGALGGVMAAGNNRKRDENNEETGE